MSAVTNADGRTEVPLLTGDRVEPGVYELTFHAGAYFRRTGAAVSEPPFLDQVVTDWTETVGKSLADKTDSVAALDQWQSRITAFAKNQGFTVGGR